MCERFIRSARAHLRVPFAMLAAVVLVSGALSGCVSVPPLSEISLYDSTRAKQASTAVDDWKAVNVAGVISTEKANLQALLDTEESLQDGLAQTHAQSELSQFLGSRIDEQVSKDERRRAGTEPPETPTSMADPSLPPKLPAPRGLAERTRDRLIVLLGPDYVSNAVAADAIKQADSDSLYLLFKARQESVKDARQLEQKTALYLALFAPDFYSAYKLPQLPSCDDVPGDVGGIYSEEMNQAIAGIKPQDAVNAKAELEELRTRYCSKSAPGKVLPKSGLTAVGKASDSFGYLYGTSQGAIGHAHLALLAAQKEQALEKATAKSAIEEYKAAQADLAAKKPPAPGDFTTEISKLQENLKKLEDLSGKTGGRTDKFVADLRLAAINGYLDELNKGISEGKTQSGYPAFVNEAILVSMYAKDAVKFKNIQATAKEMPLQVMAQQERLRLQAATEAVAARERAVDLAQQLQDNLITQAQRLVGVHDNLMRARNSQLAAQRALANKRAKRLAAARVDCDDADVIPNDLVQQTFEQQFCKGPPDARVFLLQSAEVYVDVVGRLEAKHQRLLYEQLDSLDQVSLAYSATNLQRWQALIDPSVNSLSDYYASGISPQTIASFLQAAMLVWIGHGVNK